MQKWIKDYIKVASEQFCDICNIDDFIEIDGGFREPEVDDIGSVIGIYYEEHPRLVVAICEYMISDNLWATTTQEYRDQQQEKYDPMGYYGLSSRMFV